MPPCLWRAWWMLGGHQTHCWLRKIQAPIPHRADCDQAIVPTSPWSRSERAAPLSVHGCSADQGTWEFRCVVSINATAKVGGRSMPRLAQTSKASVNVMVRPCSGPGLIPM